MKDTSRKIIIIASIFREALKKTSVRPECHDRLHFYFFKKFFKDFSVFWLISHIFGVILEGGK